MQGQEEVQHPTALPVLPLALSREDVMVVIGFDFVKVGEGLLLVAVLLLLSAKEGQVMGQEHVKEAEDSSASMYAGVSWIVSIVALAAGL
jgi:hypothetical protein